MEFAGSELDSTVARFVFGFVVIIDTQSGEQYIMGKDRKRMPVPPYSTDAETAEQIVELLTPHGFELVLQKVTFEGKRTWAAFFKRNDGGEYPHQHGDGMASAICAAGLAAIESGNSRHS